MKKIEVAAAVIRRNNEYFCVQRKNEGPLAKKWEFPGGKLEKGETAREALHRELIEELDLDIEIKEHLITVEHQYPTFFITMHVYYCDIYDNNIVLNEHIDSRWLVVEDLSILDWADADKPVVEKLQRRY